MLQACENFKRAGFSVTFNEIVTKFCHTCTSCDKTCDKKGKIEMISPSFELFRNTLSCICRTNMSVYFSAIRCNSL